MRSCMTILVVVAVAGVCEAVEKRSDDTSPLEAVVARLTSDLQALEAKVTVLTHGMDVLKTKVGFLASMGHDVTLHQHNTVKFDVVHYNDGNAYDPLLGVFTAPVTGLYSFFFKTEVTAHNRVAFQLLKEGSRMLFVSGSDPNTFETPSAQTLVQLDQGQRVWVETPYDNNPVREGFAQFGGFLVQPDFNEVK